jgi:hypothetical protein
MDQGFVDFCGKVNPDILAMFLLPFGSPSAYGHGRSHFRPMVDLLPRKNEKKKTSGIICYIICRVWKERNRRVFRNEALPMLDVVHIIHDEIGMRAHAHSDDPRDRVS